MRIIRSVRAMHQWSRTWQERGLQIGFVPTMGCLHAGHLALMQRARKEVGKDGAVVVSLFVNPAQFGPNEDFTRYPRNLPQDAKLCREAGVDVLFAPNAAQMYPATGQEEFSTYVVEENLSHGLEGASRPTHFRGVTTVVAKLFNIVDPRLAVFGQKDYQQAAVIRRMIRDLNYPVKLIVAPTVREADGLAMSSRNRYLSAIERKQAVVLWRAIQLARRVVRATRGRLPVQELRKELEGLVASQPAARIDYISFFDAATLKPVQTVERGTHLALAVFVGQTRLIDNARL